MGMAGASSTQGRDDRLSSWKEIAAYLGRDVRTVQRWERTQGLPVHRHRHSRLSTAYAYKSELDAWWHNRPPAEASDGEPLPSARAETAESPRSMPGTFEPSADKSSPQRVRAGRWLAGALAAVAVAAVGSALWFDRNARARSLGFAARDFVLIIPFENRTREELFDGTVEYALERELTESPFVNVVPRQRIRDTLELMQKPLDTRLDIDLGQELAMRDGQIRALISGRAERFGARYVLTADIRAAATGALTLTAREEADDEASVSAAVQRLATTVRTRMGETLTASPETPSLPKVTTPSLRALQLYARALDAIGESETAPFNRQAAELLLRQAIAIDPDFARAHMTLAQIADVPPTDRATLLPHVERALAAAEHAPTIERLLIQGDAHLFRSQYFVTADGIARQASLDRGAAALEALLRLQPDHFEALRRLYSTMSGPRDHARARELASRYADLRPTSAHAQVGAARLALADLDLNVARRYVARARALQVPFHSMNPGAAVWLALFDAEDAWRQGDPQRALAVVDGFAAGLPRLSGDVRIQATNQLFFSYLSLGRLRMADAMIDAMPASVPLTVRDQQRGRVLAMRGNRDALAAFFTDRFRTVEDARFVASNMMDAGLIDMPRRVVAYHRERREAQGADWYAGQLALVEGRYEDAIRQLDTVAALYPRNNNQGLKIARQIADAHHAAGRLDESIRLLDEATRQRSELVHGWEWLRGRDRLAALYREAGRNEEAQAIDRELAALLAVSDDDHAIMRRLAGAASVRR
jgi:tetratricopeptide (TPR) repeat protein